MKKTKHLAARHKCSIVAVVVAIAMAALAGCAQQQNVENATEGGMDGAATVNYSADGRYKDNVAQLPAGIDANLGSENAEKNAPASYIDHNGFTVQPVPSDEIGWNNSYLDADNRGCTSCHTLEDALMTLDTYHGTIFQGYDTEQNYSMCQTCHIWANSLKDSMHSTHLSSQLFTGEGGTCDSCHYINEDGEYKMWDFEKYSLYQGITDLAADEVDAEVTYDQETLTSVDDMFFKSIKEYGDFDASDWRTDDSYMDPELFNDWVFSIGGEVENPISMTLPELVEKFGTITTTMKQQCCINGVGNAAIMQCEVTGVPIKDIIDYVKPKNGVNSASLLTEDPYPGVGKHYNVGFDKINVEDAVLVIEVNGETLPNTQGYPCSLWVPRGSAAAAYKVCQGVNFVQVSEEEANTGFYLGGFENPYLDGAPSDKPNSGVLNYPTGVVLEDVAGTAVQLEGFADGYDEPIVRVEYSWDHGQTWQTVETPDNDPTKWTYWRMSFTPPETGAYLLTIRTTSLTPEGTERVCAMNTEFMMNVK